MAREARTSFHAELAEITREILLLAAHVTESIPRATEALLTDDVTMAQEVIDHDDELDRIAIEAEERCYRALATQQPVADDLRSIVTAVRMIAEIERSGDLVVNVCKALCSVHPLELPPLLRGQVTEMGDLAASLCRACVDAYAEGDAQLAASLELRDDRLDEVHAAYIASVLDWAEQGNVRQAIPMALIGRYYERIGDHAVNIGQRVQYLIEGRLPAHPSTDVVRSAWPPHGAVT